MNNKGFTLVELMVAIIILSIVVLSVGMILTSSWRFWNNGWQQVGVQRDASYAFSRIEKVVRAGSSAVVLGGGSGLQVTSNSITNTFQLNGNVLQLITGSTTENIVSGVQNNTPFSILGNTVTAELILQNGNSGTDFRTAILLRNAL